MTFMQILLNTLLVIVTFIFGIGAIGEKEKDYRFQNIAAFFTGTVMLFMINSRGW